MDKKHCDKPQKIKDLCVKNLHVRDLKAKNLSAEKGNITNLTSETASITNLTNVATINGVDINCDTTFNVSGVISEVIYENGDPVKPSNDNNVNTDVFNALWDSVVFIRDIIQPLAGSGRVRNEILNKFYDCSICPPYDLSNCETPLPGFSVFTANIINNILTVTDVEQGSIEIGQLLFGKTQPFLSSTIASQTTGTIGGSGTYTILNKFNAPLLIPEESMLSLSNVNPEDCIKVPLRIYGVETLPLVTQNGECRSILSAISYNLNIVNRTASTRLAQVNVEISYLDPNGGPIPIIKNIEIDTRQFDPSLLYIGEQMNNNILLPSDLVNLAAVFGGAIQISIFVEDGMDVLLPEIASSSALRALAPTSLAKTTNYSLSYVDSSANVTITRDIPPTAKTVTINAYGGGGGGGKESSFSGSGAGGGGGSGYDLSGPSAIGPKIVDLTQPFNNFDRITFTLGKGGDAAQDGEVTTVTLSRVNPLPPGSNPVTPIQFGAPGGKAGGTGVFNAGNGGDGYYGGGGGSSQVISGAGGKGVLNDTFSNGQNGSSNRSGDGGGNGGKGGGTAFGDNAGGGGGGKGGGDGQSFSNINNTDATAPSAGGGGKDNKRAVGAGRGGDGYFVEPIYTF